MSRWPAVFAAACALCITLSGRATARTGHWFTQPLSRLVVNPNMETPLPPGAPEPALPVHAAYYAGEYPARLPYLWGFLRAGADGTRGLDVMDEDAAWSPDRLISRVTLEGGGALETATVFDGPHGLLQTLRAENVDAPIVVSGVTPEGAAAVWYPEFQTIAWKTERVGFALAVPGGAWEPLGNARTWAIRLPAGTRAWTLAARVGEWPPAFGYKAPPDPLKALGQVVYHRANAGAFRETAALEKREWADRMARVPHPANFTLRVLPDMGVTPDAIRRRYEEAWAFVLSDSLPPMPENGYAYPQVACGKPSLWGEGHPKARASAQWESILGMRYLAVVDPETAWEAFEGMMSLVDAEGTMGGEGLPSVHAETAWALYQRTGDRKRLLAVYPTVQRFLLWKARDPRWMHKGATSEGVKDSEFVTSAMRDMGFAAKIARALDMPEEAARWSRGQAEMAADLRRWFWTEPGGDPYEWYDAKTGKRWGRDSAWTLETLALPLPLLGPEQRDSLLRLFRRQRDNTKPFLVPNLTKQPNLTLTRIGLSLHGTPDEAEAVAESQMRDVTLADDFAETYDQERPLHGTGVRPSLFGALNIIDGALFHNGMTLPGGE